MPVWSVPDDRGWMQVEMLFEGEHNACEHILSFGTRVEVLAPARLRQLVVETARQIVAHYDGGDGQFGILR